jgi:predicted ATP-dependent serine protease
MPFLECENCGEYQTLHSGPCNHCESSNKSLILRDYEEDDNDERNSAFWKKRHGILNTPKT